MIGASLSELHTSELNAEFSNMWQSHVEIEGYSVAYFNRIAAFGAPYC